MEKIAVILFIVGYAAIAFEHVINVNKTASALLAGALCWTVYILMYSGDYHDVIHHLAHHLSKTTEILFFLIGAMTIVELVDAHHGFKIITNMITTSNAIRLLWIISLIAFFMSAVLDNLTTAIVMVSLLKKLIDNQEQRKYYACIVIVAANAGGAWSPIGDVTTTMLWIGGQISPLNIMLELFIPSLVCLIIPLIYCTFTLKGNLAGDLPKRKLEQDHAHAPIKGQKVMLAMGIGSLVFVPIFKTVTHLPPYMGMLLALGLVWIVSEIMNKDADEAEREELSASKALSRIDTSSVLFFLGILLAIAALESMHLLSAVAAWLDQIIGNERLIVLAIGVVSAIIDNVPLVAASMGMYSLEAYPMDHELWEFMAYCAGTGGSILIIGSAAGVAVMGMEKIDFMWYVKKISFVAAIGYFAGAAVYIFVTHFFHV
ncbi:MAG: sodium:proton antiporter [Bacteroidetes bacterium]|nr:MAG: sodium:proton antiporter [Bacteroidota bacterium]